MSVAPPRDMRLMGGSRRKPICSPVETPIDVRAMMAGTSEPADVVAPPANVAAATDLESKLAAVHDPAEMLMLIQTEAALRRAQRLSGASIARRQTIRLLCVLTLLGLLAAAAGAIWYLQATLVSGHPANKAEGPRRQDPLSLMR